MSLSMSLRHYNLFNNQAVHSRNIIHKLLNLNVGELTELQNINSFVEDDLDSSDACLEQESE